MVLLCFIQNCECSGDWTIRYVQSRLHEIWYFDTDILYCNRSPYSMLSNNAVYKVLFPSGTSQTQQLLLNPQAYIVKSMIWNGSVAVIQPNLNTNDIIFSTAFTHSLKPRQHIHGLGIVLFTGKYSTYWLYLLVQSNQRLFVGTYSMWNHPWVNRSLMLVPWIYYEVMFWYIEVWASMC